MRPLLFVLGWVFVVLGAVGLVLPLLPGTLFLILAAACFTRSSPRFETWLVQHPRFGPPVRRWRETGSIPRSAKILAVVSLVASFGLIMWSDAPDLVAILCFTLFVGVAVYLVTRPET